ncbi:MAG: hypothetical protein K0R08_1365, partial [Solimicrobium sp.]|jgi:hypothetical protein|nr:hypothetical protein [Solimicrobium sp.]
VLNPEQGDIEKGGTVKVILFDGLNSV